MYTRAIERPSLQLSSPRAFSSWGRAFAPAMVPGRFFVGCGVTLSKATNVKLSPTAYALMERAIDPSSLQPDRHLTLPRSFGVYEVPTSAKSTRRYRLGNHPVRQRELQQDFGRCAVLAVFLDRKDAVALAGELNAA